MGDQVTIIDLIGHYNNLDEPEPATNRPETIIGLAVSFLVITWIAVGFRLYTRFRIIYSPGWDDLFVFLVLISGTLGSICESIATRHGMGKHFILLSDADKGAYLKYFYMANITYTMSTAFVKISLLFQYLRIFKTGRIRIICISMLIITALWGFTFAFMAITPCFPIAKFWNYAIPGTCYGYGSLIPWVTYATFAAGGSINMAFDIIVLCIPIPIYFAKDTPFKSKMGLLGLFFMGVIINFISIWRLHTIVEHRAATYPTFDPTWYAPISIELAALEVNFASICASMPVFWPILTARLDKVFVTREIKIERIHRFETVGDDAKYGDDVELQRTRTDSRGDLDRDRDRDHHHGHNHRRGASERVHNRGTSETSLNRPHTADHHYDSARDMHYRDEYVAGQVDPLSSIGKVESEISAQPLSKSVSRELGRKRSKNRDR